VYKGKFIGIPVLFIPGNSGSFRQVRSLASIALRKAIEDTKYKVHFDYFAVDFVEEFSALYGGTLEDQAAFVRQSIVDILRLYQGQKQAPTSVVLIGHSIGGLVAKSLFVDPNFDPLTINIIITLATPHSAPVINADKSLNQFYEDIDNHWNYHRQSNHVSLVSIGGGVKDIQVRPGLTWSDHADLNVQTTAASGIWVSADHRCIVWCKQLTLALNRILFDLIDTESKQLSDDKKKILEVFHYHLIRRTAGKRYRPDLHPTVLYLKTQCISQTSCKFY
jgi:glycosylphosphatidylinositol deacylase